VIHQENTLREAQLSLEAISLQDGVERYQRETQRLKDNQKYSTHSPAKDLLQRSFQGVRGGFDFIGPRHRRDQGTSLHVLQVALELIDPEVLALISLNAVANAAASQLPLKGSLQQLGQSIELEIKCSMLDKSLNPERVLSKIKEANYGTSSRLRKAFRYTMANLKADKEWTRHRRLKMGEHCLNVVLQSTDIFETSRTAKGVVSVSFNKEARAYIREMDELNALNRPKYLPMLVPPRPWSEDPKQGAYLSEALSRTVGLVRGAKPIQVASLRRGLRDGSMAPCVDALNAIQSTPYRINERMLEVIQWLRVSPEVYCEGFPRDEMIPVPTSDKPWDDMSSEERTVFKHQVGAVKAKNRSAKAADMQVSQDCQVANMLKSYPQFYVPVSCDFRGRVYPIPSFNYQRSDYVKAMFEFAEGKPLGEHGLYWLSVHIANNGDFGKISKRPFDERVRWVEENSEALLECAGDPLAHRWWLEADKPLQFLAGCFEYAGAVLYGRHYVSHLPVALDGSNSGIQHYSMALRAEEDGALVNLVPKGVPQDIYQAVADRVIPMVQEDAKTSTEPFAQQWLDFGITRKTVKRNVMTFPYSSARFGFKQQLIEDHMTPLAWDVLSGVAEDHPFGDDWGRAACGYLSGHIWTAVNETVSKAAEGMLYLRKVAGVLAHERKDVRWTNPVGFPVVHRYTDPILESVSCYIYDASLKVEDPYHRKRMVLDTGKASSIIKKSKQKSAVAPNVIHSMDAAHLLSVVNAAKAEGMDHFLLIHDSFAVHAADTERFAPLIRETLVEMYTEHDVFQQIDDYARSLLTEVGKDKLPPLPAKGNLDMDQVLQSTYAFA